MLTDSLGEHLMMAASANIFDIAIDYRNKANMKVAVTNIAKFENDKYNQKLTHF